MKFDFKKYKMAWVSHNLTNKKQQGMVSVMEKTKRLLCTFREYRMIREANKSDCINLAALSMEVWLTTYSIDGIRTENSKYALSTFTEKYFNGLLSDLKYKLLVFIEGIYLRGYALINLESQFESKENGFEIEKLYVQEPFQGQGIGQNLLSEIITRYGDRFWLYTWVRNKSIEFYKRFGFKDIGQYNFKFGNDIIENRVFAYNHT